MVEILSFFIVKIKKKDLQKNLLVSIEYSPEIIENYSEYIPYTRDKVSFNKLINHSVSNKSHINLDKNSYFFTIVNEFNKKNNSNILIQGDSWAEVFNKKENYFHLKEFSKVKKVGIINAGITSYSPSSITTQIHILKKEFKIEPNMIIAIIDQTDIGDELFRYKKINKNIFSSTLININKNFKIEAINNLNKINFSSFKLIEYLYNYYSLHKSIYNFSNIETMNMIYKNVKAKFLKIPKILYPLQFGITKNEKEIVKKSFKNYINFAFKNKNLKKIYFVSHPHLKHLEKDGYIISISSIIDEAINESDFKNSINHINFEEMNKSNDEKIYLKTDPYSHLTPDGYTKHYLPKILEAINFN